MYDRIQFRQRDDAAHRFCRVNPNHRPWFHSDNSVSQLHGLLTRKNQVHVLWLQRDDCLIHQIFNSFDDSTSFSMPDFVGWPEGSPGPASRHGGRLELFIARYSSFADSLNLRFGNYGMELVLVGIFFFCAIRMFLGDFAGQLEKSDLTRTILHGGQLDVERPVIHEFQNDRPTPTRLNPRGCLVHTQADAGIRATPLDSRNHVTRNRDTFIGLGKNEISLPYFQELRVAERVETFEIDRLPEVC